MYYKFFSPYNVIVPMVNPIRALVNTIQNRSAILSEPITDPIKKSIQIDAFIIDMIESPIMS